MTAAYMLLANVSLAVLTAQSSSLRLTTISLLASSVKMEANLAVAVLAHGNLGRRVQGAVWAGQAQLNFDSP